MSLVLRLTTIFSPSHSFSHFFSVLVGSSMSTWTTSDGLTSTESVSSPSTRGVMRMITVLSVVSDTMSSSSGTRGRGIGERRWMGEGGGIGPVEVPHEAEVDG